MADVNGGNNTVAPDDQHYTYNELSNEDKQLLLTHGYTPGDFDTPEDMRDILDDLRAQVADDEDSDRLSKDVSGDERDGTE